MAVLPAERTAAQRNERADGKREQAPDREQVVGGNRFFVKVEERPVIGKPLPDPIPLKIQFPSSKGQSCFRSSRLSRCVRPTRETVR